MEKQHEYEERKTSDEKRDRYLKSLGIIIYRVKWNEVNSTEGSKNMESKIGKFIKFYKNI